MTSSKEPRKEQPEARLPEPPEVSPYLLQPLRTKEQALEDIKQGRKA